MSQIIPPKTFQMCHEYYDYGSTKKICMKAQGTFSDTDAFQQWVRATTLKHPLPAHEKVRWLLKEGPDLTQALSTLTMALDQDESFFNSYVDNISIEFQDEMHRRKIVMPDMKESADRAARNFLSRWIANCKATW